MNPRFIVARARPACAEVATLASQRPRRFASGAKIQALRGMADIFGDEHRRHSFIANVSRDTARLFGFEEISTPIVEAESVFSRTLGQTSDVVSKEMYSFESRSGTKMSLRPEGTAGIVRALIEQEQLRTNLPQRLFYYGPMFRYERPQQGRRRQFHQVGVELLGVSDPYSDAQLIEMGFSILKKLGLDNQVQLEINTLGDEASRLRYRDVLGGFLNQHLQQLSPLSRERIERGSVLRVLDSKEKADKEIVAKAPINTEHLTAQSTERFKTILASLDDLKIPYVVNPRLVRGLDYYSETCFEFVNKTTGSAVLAGGRYDALVKQMGGPDIPGVGWAAGVERLALMLDASKVPSPTAPVAVIALAQLVSAPSVTPVIRHKAMQIATSIREEMGLPCIEVYADTVSKAFKKAAKEGAKRVVLIAEDEMKINSVAVKDLDSGDQKVVPLTDLSAILRQ